MNETQNHDAATASNGHLKQSLGPLMLWGLGVGYVISGEYFGWNLGLPLGGTYGMLMATALVTTMYVTFIFSYTELACALPKAGGAFVYATRALGPFWGYIAGIAQSIEFVFAPPAIAMAIAAYINQRFPEWSPVAIAMMAYAVFTGLNIVGVKQAALFELFVTVLAVAELLLFMGITLPSFDLTHFQTNPLPNGWSGAFACIPFAMWFYLAIEGVANAAEESRNPQRDVARGFGAAMLTLVVLAVGVFFAATGVAGWEAAVFADGSTTPSDAPLPLALTHVVGKDSPLYHLLLGIGLLGLIASFHGIILAAGRATLAMGRARFAPRLLAHVHPQTGTPVPALLANLTIGIIAILSGHTGALITLACFGAVTLYIISMISLFVLRRREPDLPRPFQAVAYPIFPTIALCLAVVCLGALTWYNATIAGIFAALMMVAVVFYIFGRRIYVRRQIAVTTAGASNAR